MKAENRRFSASDSGKTAEFTAPAEATKMVVNQQHLKQAWDTSQISTREDWNEWMQRLSVEFMKESPSHALRACMSLVDVHTPLAKELFNAAFLSCWGELYDQYQVDCVISIWAMYTDVVYDNRKISYGPLKLRLSPHTPPRNWYTAC